MRTTLVLTLSGPDRIGIVDRLTGLVLDRGGNIEASRMSRLGGEFAVLMLISLSGDHQGDLDSDLGTLRDEGYAVSTVRARPERPESLSGWSAYRISVEGADHEGIIHEVASYLASVGINIESADSHTTPAPTTGTPLFSMTATVAVPPTLAMDDWRRGLESLGKAQNLEVRVESDG